MGLYSLVAWPPEALARWVGEAQRQMSLAAFGAPHLNLRTPFEFSGDEGHLIDAFDEVASDTPAFDVHFRGWRRFPHTIFLELEPSRALLDAHARSLDVPLAPPGARDAMEYIPHLTLALGVCPWAEDDVWSRVSRLVPPLLSWRVDALALTLERRGEIVELARYRLPTPDRAPPEATTD